MTSPEDGPSKMHLIAICDCDCSEQNYKTRRSCTACAASKIARPLTHVVLALKHPNYLMLPPIKATSFTAGSLCITTLQNYSPFIKVAGRRWHVCCPLWHQKIPRSTTMFRLRCYVFEDGTKIRNIPPDGFATSSTKRLRNSQCWEEDRRILPKYGLCTRHVEFSRL